MNLFSKMLYARIILGALILLSISACERDSYTSWTCNSSEEHKVAMVLRKAHMEFKESTLDYCGSLGPQSYFDKTCPAQIEQSSTVFTPSSGLMRINGQAFNCTAL
jgi:hypothetical protein